MRSFALCRACRPFHRVIVCPANNNEVTSREELMKGLAGLAPIAVLVTALAYAADAHADIKALEEAAKKEGELTWYVAHYTSDGSFDLGPGSTEMTGVKVNVVRTTAQVAYQ